jgi:hypothetical protein
MPFKLPSPPSPGARPHELADFAELLAWDRGSTSAREIVRTLNQTDDNEQNVGCEDDEVENTESVDDVFLELEKRSRICGDAYPFQIRLGQRLEHRQIDQNNKPAVVYRYLLLCTRLNMRDDKVHVGLDGTMLFEELSAAIMREYLGLDRSKAMVFGTSVAGGFATKMRELCDTINEGGSYKAVDASGADANDGDLDALAWTAFIDSNPGKLILFGQSKTGTTWHDQITQSRPTDFARKWFSNGYFWVEPVRTLCVAESIDPDRWQSLLIGGGLLMDRCRLVEMSHRIEAGLFNQIHRWTVSAKANTSIVATVGRGHAVEWGRLYEEYHGKSYNPRKMSDAVQKPDADPYVCAKRILLYQRVDRGKLQLEGCGRKIKPSPRRFLCWDKLDGVGDDVAVGVGGSDGHAAGEAGVEGECA